MIREGVLDAAGRRADAAYGMHVFSSLEPYGQFATKPGVMLSASDGLFVTVLGAGGHGSAPHAAKDPVTAAAEMVTALQVMITRQFNMFDPVVLTVGVLQAGTARNVIPESARIEATVRTFSHASRERMMTAVPTLLKGIAHAHGLEVDVEYRTEYPLSITDENETLTAEKTIQDLFGESRLTRWATPLSGSEDFSRVMDEVPGTFIGLSAVAPGRGPHRHRVQPLPLRHVRRRRPHRRCGALRGARHCPDRSTGVRRHPLVPPLPSPRSLGEIMTTIVDPQLADRAATRKTLLGTGIGNAVEWYDWAIYATFTPFIASQLFSKADPASAVLATLAIFAVGFVARPVGGFLFGWIGDRVGRKTSMTLAVGLASLGSLMIGVAPSFAAIGVWASLMLLVARLIQGLAHGGELPSSQTYLSEVAPKEKRGLWATLIYTSGTVGILAGTLLGAILNMTLSTEAMNDWGWRVPFLVGAVMGLYALIMRSKLHETEAFEGEDGLREARRRSGRRS